LSKGEFAEGFGIVILGADPGPGSGFQERAKLLIGSVYAGVTFAVCKLIRVAVTG
jgi:hypothetical protein